MDHTNERFEALFASFETAISDYCARRLTPSAVDDAVAEVFSVAWRKIESVPADGDALRWLYGVAYRVVTRQWRSQGRLDQLVRRNASMSVVDATDAADDLVEDEDRRLVLEAAAALAPVDQEILRLTLWEELTPTDAAVVLDITPDAAKQRAHRARQRLVQAFRRLAGEESVVVGEHGGLRW
jgi:RNA polymerase sigma-70 factor (ECF subfamily)